MPTSLGALSKNTIASSVNLKSERESPIKSKVKNSTLADFNAKFKDAKIKCLLNPFSFTPSQEKIVKFTISSKEFIPNTWISKKHDGKFKECLKIDLPQIAKTINRYTPTQEDLGASKHKRRK